MTSDLVRSALITVKTEAAAEPWPCACLEPLPAFGLVNAADWHHTPIRQGKAGNDAQLAALYHRCNGLLVHHSCHDHEGAQFELTALVIVCLKNGGPQAIRDWLATVELRDKSTPELFELVARLWNVPSGYDCLACGEAALHSRRTGQVWYQEPGPGAVCWRCLWHEH